MAKIYIIATPIGNLEDITKRALRILEEVDLVLCEDTRTTQNLLNHFNINAPTESYFQHSSISKIGKILKKLKKGQNLALVTEAGTPGISDPVFKLIKKIVDKEIEAEIIPIPGASALSATASVCHFPMNRFLFLGFPPKKRKRKKFFKQIKKRDYPVILYESPYRVLKTLKEIKKIVGEREIIVAREITKKFENIYRGKTDQIIKKLEKAEGKTEDKIKGEFTIVINSK